jgi:hypothetical protein
MNRKTTGAFLGDGSKFPFLYPGLCHGRFPGRVVHRRDHFSVPKRSVPQCMVPPALPGLRAYGVALPLGSLGVRVQAALIMESAMNATAARRPRSLPLVRWPRHPDVKEALSRAPGPALTRPPSWRCWGVGAPVRWRARQLILCGPRGGAGLKTWGSSGAKPTADNGLLEPLVGGGGQ